MQRKEYFGWHSGLHWDVRVPQRVRRSRSKAHRDHLLSQV